jgi:predicted transcriptional regulator
MVRRNRLDPKDKAVLEFLYGEGCPCTVQEIAKGVNMNWVSTKTHLKKLAEHEFVLEVERPNKTMWEFNYDKQKEAED